MQKMKTHTLKSGGDESIKKISHDIYKNTYSGDKKATLLSNNFLGKTHHTNNDTIINITPLLDYYDINSNQLLWHMYMPLYFKYYWNEHESGRRFEYSDQEITLHDVYPSIKSGEYHLRKANYGIKKLHNIELNIKFKQYPHEEQIIDIKNFDSVNGDGVTYGLLLNMISRKMEECDIIYTGRLSIYCDYTVKRIIDICDDLCGNVIDSKILCDEFINNTIHTNADTLIDITALLNKYNISTSELLYYMVKDNQPFNMGMLNNSSSTNIDSIEKATQVLNNNNHSIDYYNGIAVKNSFRKNITDKQIIDIKKSMKNGNFWNSRKIHR